MIEVQGEALSYFIKELMGEPGRFDVIVRDGMEERNFFGEVDQSFLFYFLIRDEFFPRDNIKIPFFFMNEDEFSFKGVFEFCCFYFLVEGRANQLGDVMS